MKKSKLTPWLLLTPFLAVTVLVVIAVWNVKFKKVTTLAKNVRLL